MWKDVEYYFLNISIVEWVLSINSGTTNPLKVLNFIWPKIMCFTLPQTLEGAVVLLIIPNVIWSNLTCLGSQIRALNGKQRPRASTCYTRFHAAVWLGSREWYEIRLFPPPRITSPPVGCYDTGWSTPAAWDHEEAASPWQLWRYAKTLQ